MTLARTNRIGSLSSFSYGTGSYTTGSFTPSNASLLVVICSVLTNGGSTDPSGSLTISDSVGLTWTAQVNVGDASAWSIGMRIWTAPVTTGASMTATVDCGAIDIYGYGVSIVDYTGYGAVGTTGSNSALGTNGAGSVTLGASPASASEIIGGITQDPTGTPGATPDTGHVELYDLSVTDIGVQSQVRSPGSTSTSFAWSDIATSANLYKSVGAAIEITEAGGGAPVLRRAPAAPVWRRSLNLT